MSISDFSTYNDSFENISIPQSNTSSQRHIPADLLFNEKALTAVVVYSVLFVVAAVGNLTVFITLFRNRHRKSRINLLLLHLSIADLIVTFVMIPMEVGWRLTSQWLAGNAACKAFLFLRAFGLYLSSMVLVCVSLDRYFAILYPLKVNDARRRGKLMLLFAWTTSILCSTPQSVVFHVARHPEYPQFQQCVTFGFFQTAVQEMAYNLFCVIAMYFIPLTVICFAYSKILWVLCKKSRETTDDYTREERYRGRLRLRRSDISNIERARSRTLRMTLVIVIAFIWCWTPYVVMTLWYMFDREGARQVDNRLQDALFIMAVSNSCVNPVVYGTYAFNFRRECQRCFGMKVDESRLNRKSTVTSLLNTKSASRNGPYRESSRERFISKRPFSKQIGNDLNETSPNLNLSALSAVPGISPVASSTTLTITEADIEINLGEDEIKCSAGSSRPCHFIPHLTSSLSLDDTGSKMRTKRNRKKRTNSNRSYHSTAPRTTPTGVKNSKSSSCSCDEEGVCSAPNCGEMVEVGGMEARNC